MLPRSVPPNPSARDDGASQRRRSVPGRNLPVAIVSGVVLAAAFLATLFVSVWVFLVFVAVLILLALIELDVAFRSQGLRPATPVAIGAGMVMFFGAYASGPAAQSLGLVLVVLGTLAWVLLDPATYDLGREADRVLGAGRVAGSVGATCLISLWVPFLASFIGLLLLRPHGQWYVAAAVTLAVVNDIAAFFFGSRFGRHRLAPKVSPGKTWEGMAGGLVTVLAIAAALGGAAPGFDLRSALLFGGAVALAATLGDLSESLVKRDLGVKDLGRIMPGHGGIMDRVDAIVFALPTAHLVLVALGL